MMHSLINKLIDKYKFCRHGILEDITSFVGRWMTLTLCYVRKHCHLDTEWGRHITHWWEISGGSDKGGKC